MRRRAEAWQRFAASSFPTEAEEVWRYSGIDAFDLGAFGPVSPEAAGDRSGQALAVARRLADSLGPRAGLVVTRNGMVDVIEVAPPGLPDALVVSGVSHAPSPVSAPEALGTLAHARDAFGELHDAFMADLVHISVARKAVVPDPVVVVHLIDPDPGTGHGVAVFPRVVVELGESAEAGVIELTAPGDGAAALPDGEDHGPALPAALVVPVTELRVSDDARLRYANLQVLGQGTTSIALQASCVGRDATLRSFTAGLGGRYARVRTDSDLLGQAGRTSLLAAYLGTGPQVHDFRTLQDHHAPRTESQLLFEGAVADTARSVYSGLIRIRKGRAGPTPSRRTTTSCSPRGPMPIRCPTSRSTRTT